MLLDIDLFFPITELKFLFDFILINKSTTTRLIVLGPLGGIGVLVVVSITNSKELCCKVFVLFHLKINIT